MSFSFYPDFGKLSFSEVLRNAINDFEKAAQDFQLRSKSLNTEKLVVLTIETCIFIFYLQCVCNPSL